ncbi:MAG: TRAP transporter small permease [Deltaproteobacteria bacterium]|nr:TRAP transporter small permease [Deltaproteobacteria bacterium]
MRGFINQLSLWCARLTGVVVVLLTAVLVVSLLASIFYRYVLGHALSWPEEISLILFAWIVLLAGSLGVRERFHVRLTIFTSRLPSAVAHALDVSVTLAVGVFGGLLVFAGRDLVARTAQHLTATLRLPLDWLNYAAPVCGLLIVIHTLYLLTTPPAPEDQP